VAYTKAVRAAALPWNQRRERRAAPWTENGGRLGATVRVRDGRRDWPGW
jgi:hypothetical protein